MTESRSAMKKGGRKARPVAKKVVAKKVVAKKAVAKKVVAKKAKPASKAKARKGVGSDVVNKTAQTKASMQALLKKALGRGEGSRCKLTAADRKALTDVLHELRKRVTDEISFLTGDNLNRSQRDTSGDLSNYSMHMADQGTDNFDREFALSLASSEQDVLYDIDDALQRLKDSTYGICEACGEPIEKVRLEALPFARMCIRCKSATEKGKTKFRPFGPTMVGE